MAKMGRKKIPIDWDQFDRLCHLQCSLREIASYFKCSEDTIERAVKRKHRVTFADHFATKRGTGKIALRRKQFDMALGGSVPLLIWLGKQYLDQSDQISQDTSIVDKRKEGFVFLESPKDKDDPNSL